MHEKKLGYVEDGFNLSQWYVDQIKDIPILPILSDPTLKDGDGDGYWDKDDIRPLKCDVFETSLKDSTKFVPVIDGTKTWYGGDQEWFDFTVGQYGGCGTVAAANIFAYMAKENQYQGLYSYNPSHITKSAFTLHMNQVYEYVTPKKLPFVDKNASPINVPIFGKVGWTVGIWPLSSFVNDVEKFAKSKNVSLEAVYANPSKFTRDNAIKYIKEGLNKDKPMALLIGLNSEVKSDITYPDNKQDPDKGISRHWVTITEIKEDYITNEVLLKISTWGGYGYINLDDVIEGERIYTALMYFE